MALGSTQPLTEMSTRNIPGGKGRPARKADCLENVGASTSHNPTDLHGLLQGYLWRQIYRYQVSHMTYVRLYIYGWTVI
jgi:hypothetical protein